MINNSVALRDFIMFLKRRYDNAFFTIANSFNYNRHRLIIPPHGSDLPRFYVVFKKSGFFQSFNYNFKSFTNKYPEFKGLGESINLEWLKVAIAAKADYLVFIHVDGHKYIVSTKLVYNFVNKYNLFRTQNRVNEYQVNGLVNSTRELTASFPIRLLENLEEVIR